VEFLGLLSDLPEASSRSSRYSGVGERALTVFAVLLPFLTVLVFLLAELLTPHA
jgi:hypothetical protein